MMSKMKSRPSLPDTIVRRNAWALTVMSALLPVLMAPNPAPAEPAPPGAWLLNRGRTIGLDAQQPTVDNAEHVLVWMEAAVRVNPDLAEAYLWQYDLLNRLSRPEAAMAALASYCKLNPEDISARLDSIDWKFERCQSVEARLALCAKAMATAAGSPPLRSDLHRRMAELHMRSGDREQALTHATKALEAFTGNVAANLLLVELADERNRRASQVRMLLAVIATSPGQVEQMWELARLLDDLSLHAEAAKWYERLVALIGRRQADASVPVHLLTDLAVSHADDGRYEQALEVGERAIGIDSDSVEAGFLLVDVARRAGRVEVANHHLDVLKTRFGGVEPTSLGQKDLARACSIAWYYLRYEPDSDRALQFASRARELAPEEPDVQVAYGLAKLAAGQSDEVASILRPWADDNQWAAAGLGEALLAEGNTEQAIQALRAGEALRHSGRAYERITNVLAAQGHEPTPIPHHAAVIDALRSFDERVLSFVDRPADVLRLEVTVPGNEWAYGDPWVCELCLRNTGPFPIYIGQGEMVAAELLVSVRWGDEPEQQLVNYLPLSLALRPVLAPGDCITRKQTLDIGPAAKLAASEPQREFTLDFSFLFDPVIGLGSKWVSAVRDFPPSTVRVRRIAVDASRTGRPTLLSSAQQGEETERIRAVRTLAALIAEREAARKTPPTYFAHRVDEMKLRRFFLSALGDPTPVVRAAALDSARTIELGPKVLQHAAPLLSDDAWLVRLLALDLLSETQGRAFQPVLERSSVGDPDGLVRRFAALRLKQLGPPPAE